MVDTEAEKAFRRGNLYESFRNDKRVLITFIKYANPKITLLITKVSTTLV